MKKYFCTARDAIFKTQYKDREGLFFYHTCSDMGKVKPSNPSGEEAI